MCAIGRALMADPRLLLCDEISLGLAPIVIRDIYAALPTIKAEGAAVIIVEQDDRDEPAHARQILLAQNRFQLLGVRRQEPLGSELGGGQPGAAHLGEHPVGVELVAPAGHLAHTPRDRCPGNPNGAHAFRTSSRSTGAPRRRDSVAASASQATSTASVTVAPGMGPPLVTSTNAASSVRNASVKRSMKK